jgi:uncharacterized protein with beta-barrel porin domain
VSYADANGPYAGDITINAANFDNRGVVGASGLGTLALAGAWTNSSGTVAVQGGTVKLSGTFNPASIGTWS